jgi:acyl dehydratase
MPQNLRFTAPVKAGDTITAVATVREVNMENAAARWRRFACAVTRWW